MSTRFYDADLSNAAWAFVAPVLPAARPGGRPRTTGDLGPTMVASLESIDKSAQSSFR
jgi:hypothetical protein